MYFTENQMNFINQFLPDIQNKESDDDYTVDELCLIVETVTDKLVLECFDENYNIAPDKKAQADMCYSILDMIGET